MMSWSTIPILVAAFSIAACGGTKGDAVEPGGATGCGSVGAKIVKMMGATAGLHDDAGRRSAHQALAGACITGDWSDAARECFIGAADEAATAACGDQLTDTQRMDLAESLGTPDAKGPAPGAPASE